jgi:hypothetical protein
MRYGHHRSEYVVFSLFTFARRATLAAAIHLRAAAEIARAQPVGNLCRGPHCATMDAARCVQIKQRMGMVQSLFLSVFGNAMNKKWEHDVSLSQCFPRFKQRGTVQ